MAAWVNTDTRARMLLSPSGRLYWANDAALRMLEQGGAGLRLLDNIVVADEATAPMFTRLLNKASGDGAVHALTSAIFAHQWLFRAQQLIPGDDVVIGLTGQRIADPVSCDAMLLIYSLTPAETRIVRMILSGLETSGIAQAQDISIETLRTHIKHAYLKLGVRSRGELFAKAFHFAGL